jgi:hypothetical protein
MDAIFGRLEEEAQRKVNVEFEYDSIITLISG